MQREREDRFWGEHRECDASSHLGFSKASKAQICLLLRSLTFIEAKWLYALQIHQTYFIIQSILGIPRGVIMPLFKLLLESKATFCHACHACHAQQQASSLVQIWFAMRILNNMSFIGAISAGHQQCHQGQWQGMSACGHHYCEVS